MSQPSAVSRGLWAAFLWWTGLVTVRGVRGVGSAALLFLLARAGGLEASLTPLSVARTSLALVALWGFAVAALRPGALEPGPAWLRPWVVAVALILFLCASAANLLAPTAETMVLSRMAPVELLAEHVQRATFLGFGAAVIHALTMAVVGVVLWARARERP